MFKLVVDCRTGEERRVPLSDEERAERSADLERRTAERAAGRRAARRAEAARKRLLKRAEEDPVFADLLALIPGGRGPTDG